MTDLQSFVAPTFDGLANLLASAPTETNATVPNGYRAASADQRWWRIVIGPQPAWRRIAESARAETASPPPLGVRMTSCSGFWLSAP